MTVGAPRPLRHAATPTATNLQSTYAASMPSDDPILLAAQHWRTRKHQILTPPRPTRNANTSPRRTDMAVADQRQPRPRTRTDRVADLQRQSSRGSVASKASSRASNRTTSKPDLPPTPPMQSHASSGSHSARPSSLTFVNDPASPPLPPLSPPSNDAARRSETPGHKKSPPTPDVTPPTQSGRSKTRPGASARIGSTDTGGTTESRSESFKTAPEDPWSSVEDNLGGGVGLGVHLNGATKNRVPSAKTSQSTVRPAHAGGSNDGVADAETDRDMQNKTPTPPERQTSAQDQSGRGLEVVGPRLGRGAVGLRRGSHGDGPASPVEKFMRDWSSRSTRMHMHNNTSSDLVDNGNLIADFSDDEAEVEQEWDENLGRTVVVRKRRPSVEPKTLRSSSPSRSSRSRRPQDGNGEAVGDTTQKETALPSSPRNFSLPTNSQHSVATDTRRFSGMSTHSAASTVVEAVVVDAPPPRRRRTLRHVRKHGALRDSGSDMSTVGSVVSSAATTAASNRDDRDRDNERINLRTRVAHRPDAWRSQSIVSNTSISSRSARKEVWKSGAIPVIVVPGRQSSSWHTHGDDKSLLRSSSKRSQRSNSVRSSSVRSRQPESATQGPEPSLREGSGRRSRRMSESDRSERTIDFPPVVPRRSSSLSAPTSRNGSRAGSMKEDSLVTRNALQIHIFQTVENAARGREQGRMDTTPAPAPAPAPVESKITPEPAPVPESVPEPIAPVEQEPESPVLGSSDLLPSASRRRPLSADSGRRFSFDRSGEQFTTKRLSAYHPPLSMISIETSMTNTTSHAEVSQATAVNIYPHQNSSVLVVEHTRQSDEQVTPEELAIPTITYTRPKGPGGLITPPLYMSMNDVDSPLRNPRAPPQPPTRTPALALTLATPSGLMPASEKKNLMGNYFEMTGQKPPGRSGNQSIVRRALSLTRKADSGNPPLANRPGLLRTFSLSRSLGRSGSKDNKGRGRGRNREVEELPADRIVYPTDDRPPPEEDKLHPFYEPPCHGCGHPDCDAGERTRGQQVVRFRLPSPPPPKRSLSARIKKAFLPRVDSREEVARPPTRHGRSDQDHGDVRPATRAGPIERGREGHDEDDNKIGQHEFGQDEFRTEPEKELELDFDLEPDLMNDAEPERREIRRTPSGNLRVLPFDPKLQSPLRPQFVPYIEAGMNNAGRRRRQNASEPREMARPLSVSNRYPPLSGNHGIGMFPIEPLQGLTRRLSERRRERRSQELRRKISGPKEFRDPVQDVLRPRQPRPARDNGQPLTTGQLQEWQRQCVNEQYGYQQQPHHDPRFAVGAAM